MKKVLICCLFIFVCACFISAVAEDNLDISTIEKRDSFIYDETTSSWTYYQRIDKTLDDGTFIDLLFLEWGNKSELVCFPEFRVFSYDANDRDYIVQSATIMIDGNMYEIKFDEFVNGDFHGATFYMTNLAIPLMKSFATANTLSSVFRFDGGTFSFTLDETEMEPIRRYIYDLFNIDFLNHVTSSELDKESWYQEKSPIESYVFNEIILSENKEEQELIEQNTENDWKEYDIKDIGIELFLPSNFTVYTRGMNDFDPAIFEIGMSPEQRKKP